ncbi:DNA cytosine methyltransferase [Marinobacter mangrovi]|uniref:DNA cytosine methyltransferase n=1 Tax=Marinobacter mangrovi TaxID=2803918 RepID=UPI0019338D4D|nr:DNA cytosine methyltransferase [Marinobacter mangrovi]
MSASAWKMIDLFAGAGGLSEGLREAGFHCLYANEVEPRYSQTYMANHTDTFVETNDIRSVDPLEVKDKLGLKAGELDLIAGGPPCQGFSINAPNRSSEDERNHLFRHYLKFVKAFQPRAVLIENVPGLVSFEGGATLEAILLALEDLGYNADVKILYAPHFGVPQTRWRTIVVGVKDGDPLDAYPEPLRNAPMRVNFTSSFAGRSIVALPSNIELPPHTTVREAIGDLPEIKVGDKVLKVQEYRTSPENDFQKAMRIGSTKVVNHEPPILGAVNIKRASYIPPGGNWTDIPFELLPKGMQRARRSDHTKRYGRVHPDGLASTILTKCDPHWGAYFHYSQDRTFTVREAARIQTFPDHFHFLGTKAEQYEQVGNAVPPLLAYAIGCKMAGLLEKIAVKEAQAGQMQFSL